MAAKSFIEILEERIRKEIELEYEGELKSASKSDLTNHSGRATGADFKELRGPAKIAARADRLEVWLATNLEKSEFKNPGKGHKSYASSAQRRNSSVSPHARAQQAQRVPPRSFTADEICALELLQIECNIHFSNDFSQSDLKAAWRKAALLTHPDRYAQANTTIQAAMAQKFTALATAFQVLENSFKQQAA